ncbi:hypothetical protein HPB51_008966 [Rhipicephalus microplus]|uniref:E3 ubiquitin-protein ligase n=1 Tax=Rhipicephalus microplus TaxID=6941 RepID=A0A9J6ET41_RHIMP|nr:hypothetical protein HPB51_008966 [Rhipicephalus microplus]
MNNEPWTNDQLVSQRRHRSIDNLSYESGEDRPTNKRLVYRPFTRENVVVTATNFRRVEAFCWVALQTCLGRDFVVMLRKRNNRVSRNHFFGAVLLIGLSEEALRFLYRFELRGAEHRLSWSARTRNLHSQTETDRSGGGLVLDMSTAERLCNGADLIMDVTVSVAPSLSGDNVL